ncbi:sigma-70 family RNA polymerase sigma factor [Nocardiopsis sp. L17-MgMaSL7]|uniref:sigma-70 family RNA polymerase sigma factor n=1 Tax=Nocardiopsis sp. L17-MgMaSL7 TaxID=1938893 RepID=UPI000D71910A|nr:sigma-70 family RNA polymerase sigma factor [Nocardiopsis sp. L17-MgMaSL7]PWV54726.1 RNA polymerase ECF family sigma subunit [Nocardiopsis sp. L17-MgMaSL7]
MTAVVKHTTGTDQEFERLVAPYRRELYAHCYRMLGSAHDAEDLLQETYLRAWKGYDRFEGRSSLRTWLHRIATTACLTALERRGRRPLPTGLGGPTDTPGGALAERSDLPWLEPMPDVLGAPDDTGDPGAVVASRESVRLALVAALQYLQPRQRAVLILRDVLRFSAAEVAQIFDTSVPAVNSLLQRARAQLGRVSPEEDSVPEPRSDQREILDRYVAAFESYDIRALTELFTAEAAFEMPPFATWVHGAENIGRLIDAHCPAQGPGDLAMVPTSANGRPAFGMYLRAEDGSYRAFGVHALTLAAEGVRHCAVFFDTGLFRLFDLPAVLTRS